MTSKALDKREYFPFPSEVQSLLKLGFLSLALLGCLCFSSAQAVPLQNGDFSSFDGWFGDKGDLFGGAITTLVGEAGLAGDANFGVAPRATLLNDSTNFGLSLYQVFDLSSGASTLSFDYGWTLSDAGADEVSATLFDAALNPVLDLFLGVDVSQNVANGSVSANVSALAAGSYRLEFNLIDGDFNETDNLHLANVVVQDLPGTVPLPATWLLVCLGLVGLRHATCCRGAG